MDLKTAQTTTTAKLPILKQGEYDMWRLSPVTTEEKAQKKNDVKARSMLLMALPNEHLMTFNQYKDARTLFAAIQTRFGGNEATKKTQKTLLKQMYKNFSAPKDLNLKFLRSLPSEWNNHIVVWRNKPDLRRNGALRVSTANTQVSPASTQDLEQIHEDDIEEMDLKWQLALLSMRTRRGPRNQDSRNRNQVSSRRTVNVEETSSKAMVAIDGAGFDWSYITDDEVPTNIALMSFSDSEEHNDKTCSKTCLKSFKTLKTQLDELRIEFNKSEFNLATYKRGLASVEEQLVFYKKNEVIFCEQLAVLKRDISYKDSEISMLKNELEKLKQKKESNQVKIENFDNASKSLEKLIESQNLTKVERVWEEFQQHAFEGYGPKPSKSVSEDTSNEVRESPDAPLVKKLMSDDKLEKKIVFPTDCKLNCLDQTIKKKPVKEQLTCFVYGSFDHVHAHCNYHQREMVESRNNYARVNYNYSTKKTHPSAHRNMVLRAVLMKTGLKTVYTARPVTTAHPKTIVYSARLMSHFSKSAQSTVKRLYQIRTTLTNKNSSQKVNTAKRKFYTARQKSVNTARPNSAEVNAVRENQVNAVKASACWVWRPTKLNSALITLKRHNYIDARGISKVLDLENTKTSQVAEIAKLKEKVKKLERRSKSRTPGLKRLKKVGRTARIESYEDEGLGAQEDASKQGRKIADLDADVEEVEVEKVVSTAEVTTTSTTTTTVDELTLAQTLIEIKAAKPKAVTTAATTTTTAVTRPKARGS
ncbi:hypothetical protein Tco_0594874 [Tanacetum coccineum]